MSPHHAPEPRSLLGDGSCWRRLSWSLTSASLARNRFEMVLRLSQNCPGLGLPANVREAQVVPTSAQSRSCRPPRYADLQEHPRSGAVIGLMGSA